VLGVGALVTGFTIVTLLAAVVGIVLSSLAAQDMAADPSLRGRGLATAGLWCGVAALIVWLAVGVVVVATRGV
jgi:hypothetical protein